MASNIGSPGRSIGLQLAHVMAALLFSAAFMKKIGKQAKPLVLVVLTMAGCGSRSEQSESANDAGAASAATSTNADATSQVETDLVVISTVSPITSIVESILGDRAQVIGLVPEGANSHTFEPPPSAAKALSEADIIFVNGLQLEEPLRLLALANKQEGVHIVALGDEVLDPSDYQFDFSFPRDEGKPNPHLWTDPDFVVAYAEIVAETMARIDPEGAQTYDRNLEELRSSASKLDRAMSEAFDTIDPNDRVLLTYHDAYAYFAQHYGFDVVGAVQPASFGEPSPKDVANLIRQVRDEDVPALFGSEVFPSPVLEQISAETGGTYIDSLRDDDLPGQPGDAEHSWFGLLRSNYIVMTTALGGDAEALLDLPQLVAPGSGEYPQ